MLKIQRTANGEVVLAVIGQLQADSVDELSALLAEETDVQTLALDLKDLVLADREAVRFLQECEARGVELRHCPGYIRTWIGKGSDLD
jgi:hypothetical protein